jgi:hypothetical protein
MVIVESNNGLPVLILSNTIILKIFPDIVLILNLDFVFRYQTLYPQTKEDLVFQKRVDYWKEKVGEILVSLFNSNSWGQ